jgi:hypothetical protein
LNIHFAVPHAWDLKQDGETLRLFENAQNASIRTKKEGVERRHSCAEIAHCRNTTLGNPNTIDSGKLHHRG